MASYLDKFKITTALDTNTTMDLSCTHITTSDWMHCSPVYIKEMVPGETLKVHQETFTRLAPMSTPTFGRGLIHNRAFFVPFRTIFKKWNDFITAADINSDVQGNGYGTDVSVTVNKVPLITNECLVRLFCYDSVGVIGSNDFATVVIPGAGYDKTKHDILLRVTDGPSSAETEVTSWSFDLTTLGRRVMKILQSLGYAILWKINRSGTETDKAEYSALPLMAFLKVIYDWYYPSQYVGDADYRFVGSILENTPTSTGVYSFSVQDLRRIFGKDSPFNGLVNYDSDYFVSAFDHPLGPSQGSLGGSVTGDVMFRDINYLNSNGIDGTNGAPYGAVGVVNYPNVTDGDVAVYSPRNGINTPNTKQITQYGLDALKALTDYMKRHQLVGARALDRFYARFGKSLDSAKMDRSYYIGSDNISLQIGDVMAHADTSGAQLGDYAGKGIAFGANGNYEFSTDEYGVMIILSSVVPQIGYYQGIDRNVMHIGRTDFYTPEFDSLGNQAIFKKELYLPMNVAAETSGSTISGMNNTDLNVGIFGFTPRYAEYKIGRDRLTGDYRLASKNGAGDTSNAWHLMRNIGDFSQTSANLVHSSKFVTGRDYAQYNRVFNSTGDTADKFYVIHTFNVQSQSPMHSLYDTYKFENEDEGAKKVVGDVNGVKVN